MNLIRSSRRVLPLFVVIGLAGAACSSSKDSSTTTVPTTSSGVTGTAPELTGAGLNLGVLAPSPGLSATLFQAQTRGISFAASDVASGGGVLGGELNVATTDTPLGKTEADIASTAVEAGAEVLIGPATSSSALTLLPKLADLKTVACSASATLPGLTAGQTQPSLFRTALPDDVLGAYLADKIVERRDATAPDAPWKVAIVARADDYGLSVGNGLAASLLARGLDPTVLGYNPERVQFDGLSQNVTSLKPDVTVLISFEEGANLLSSLIRAGMDPKTMVGLDGFFAPRLGAIVGGANPKSVDGFTVLGTTGDKAFLKRLTTADPTGQVAYAAQAYDCAIVLALASEAVAASTDTALPAAVQAVTAGGLTCTTYADCHAKLAAGEDIDYDGVSGKLAINKDGDPTSARFTTGQMKDGKLEAIASTDVDLAALALQQEAFAAAAFNTKLQQALRFLGFYSGPIDGIDSPELTTAIADFQTSVGLEPTGLYDAATDKALREALGVYSNLLSSSTAGLQQLLTTLGFYTGPIDGVWSTAVTDAMKALQTELGVPPTGVPDAATLSGAYKRGVASGTPPTTVPGVTVPVTTPPVTTPVPPLPPVDPGCSAADDLFAKLNADPQYSTFVKLLVAAGFNGAFPCAVSYTVFAPTNAAFDKLPAGVLDSLLSSPGAAKPILGIHIIEGPPQLSPLPAGDLETINGSTVAIAVTAPPDGSAAVTTVGGAAISSSVPEVKASNGVIHAIDSLIQTVTSPGG